MNMMDNNLGKIKFYHEIIFLSIVSLLTASDLRCFFNYSFCLLATCISFMPYNATRRINLNHYFYLCHLKVHFKSCWNLEYCKY